MASSTEVSQTAGFHVVNTAGLRRTERSAPVDHPSINLLQIILKTTERCNIACKYCYFYDERNDDTERRPAVIADQTIENLIVFIERAIRENRLETVNVSFHGGEPLLMKKERFNAACHALRQRLAGKVGLALTVQTNGMLIDDEWIEIFRTHSISVGVSIDGDKEVHDAMRIDHQGRGTYDRVIAGFRRAHAALPGMVSLLSVVGPRMNTDGVLSHMAEALDFKKTHFILRDETHDSADAEFIDASRANIVGLFNAWVKRGDPTLRIRFIDYAIQGLISGFREAIEAAEYNFSSYLAITVRSDGDIGPNDDLRNIFPEAFSTGLNIAHTSLSEFLANPEIQAIHAAIDATPAACADCCWKTICRSGEIVAGPLSRYSRDGGFDNQSLHCEAMKEFLTELTRFTLRSGIPFERIAPNLN